MLIHSLLPPPPPPPHTSPAAHRRRATAPPTTPPSPSASPSPAWVSPPVPRAQWREIPAWTVLGFLGHGAFGMLLLVTNPRHPTSRYALKLLPSRAPEGLVHPISLRPPWLMRRGVETALSESPHGLSMPTTTTTAAAAAAATTTTTTTTTTAYEEDHRAVSLADLRLAGHGALHATHPPSQHHSRPHHDHCDHDEHHRGSYASSPPQHTYMTPSAAYHRAAAHEWSIMTRVSGCPFVSTPIGACESGGCLLLLSPAYPGRDLFHHLHEDRHPRWRLGVPGSHVAFYGATLALALLGMHQRDILHLDVKLENVVLDADGYPVLVDLGQAMSMSTSTSTRKSGGGKGGSFVDFRHKSSAPEVRPGGRVGIDVGPSADAYALGALVRDMLQAPPTSRDEGAQMKRDQRSMSETRISGPQGPPDHHHHHDRHHDVDGVETEEEDGWRQNDPIRSEMERWVAALVRPVPADRPRLEDVVPRWVELLGVGIDDLWQRRVRAPFPGCWAAAWPEGGTSSVADEVWRWRASGGAVGRTMVR